MVLESPKTASNVAYIGVVSNQKTSAVARGSVDIWHDKLVVSIIIKCLKVNRKEHTKVGTSLYIIFKYFLLHF